MEGCHGGFEGSSDSGRINRSFSQPNPTNKNFSEVSDLRLKWEVQHTTYKQGPTSDQRIMWSLGRILLCTLYVVHYQDAVAIVEVTWSGSMYVISTLQI